MVKKLDPKLRKNFILMERIRPEIIENILVSHEESKLAETVSEISQYGIIITKAGQVTQNVADGYLIRTKPVAENEGGLMSGVGALTSMTIVE